MPFFRSSTTFAKPRSKKQTIVSDKWVRLGEPKKRSNGLRRVGRKGEWWIFVGLIVNRFFNKIDLVDRCEIQNEVCDGYHKAWAHTRRRQDIRVGDWWYALRVVRACQECHFWADALQEGRSNSEVLLESIAAERFKNMGLSDARVRELLLECAAEIQKENPGKDGEPGKFDHFVVVL